MSVWLANSVTTRAIVFMSIAVHQQQHRVKSLALKLQELSVCSAAAAYAVLGTFEVQVNKLALKIQQAGSKIRGLLLQVVGLKEQYYNIGCRVSSAVSRFIQCSSLSVTSRSTIFLSPSPLSIDTK